MQKALEGALDRAEYVIESAQQRPPPRKGSSSGGRSLHEKLYDIYVEECGKEPEVTEELISNVNLLEKLLMRESLSRLVVNLYPATEGYSLMLQGLDGSYSENIWLPYEEWELLEYLDAEELPPVLLDVLEKCPVNMFHSGCVIAEIRDYRQRSDPEGPGYQSRHVLLRPTMQTLACDIQSITSSDNEKWTQEDSLAGNCVDTWKQQPCDLEVPSEVDVEKYAEVLSPVKYDDLELTAWPAQEFDDDFVFGGEADDGSQTTKLSFVQPLSDSLFYGQSKSRQEATCELEVPSEVDVEKYAEVLSPVKYDDLELTAWPAQEFDDDFVFGGEADDGSQTTKLSFVQPLSDSLFYGQSKSRQEATCELEVPSEVDVEKYAEVLSPVKYDDLELTAWPAQEFDDDFVFGGEADDGSQTTKLSFVQPLSDSLFYGQSKSRQEATCELEVPSEVDVEKYAEVLSPVKYDDLELTAWPAQEFDFGSLLGCDAGDQSHTTQLTFLQPLNAPLISGKRSSDEKVRYEGQTPSCQSSPDDHSNSSMPGSKTDAGRVVGGSKKLVQKKTKRPVKVSRIYSSSANFRKIYPKKEVEQPEATSVQSSVRGKGVKHTPSRKRKSSSGNRVTPRQVRRILPKPIYPAPASRAPGLAQKSSVEVYQVSTFPAATLFLASSSLTALVTQVKASSAGLNVIQVVNPVDGPRSNPVQYSTVVARNPSGVNTSKLSSGGQTPNAQSAAPQAPSLTGAQYILEPASHLRPLTLLQVPQGSVIVNIQQQDQQPQLIQQQCVYNFIPQQPQQPTTLPLQQPVVLQSSSAQVSTSQVMALPGQQAVFINLNGVGSFLQPQATVLSQHGSAQTEPRQNHPQQKVLLSSAFQQQLQYQQVQWRIVQHPGPVAMVAAQNAQPQGAQGQWRASQSRENIPKVMNQP